MIGEMTAWLTRNWNAILVATLAILLGTAVISAVCNVTRLLKRERRAWFAAAAFLALCGYLVLWLRYAAFRVYITPVLTLAVGFGAGLGWSGRRAWWPPFSGRASLARFACLGASWSDTLQVGTLDFRKWLLQESEPSGMALLTGQGLAVEWKGGPPGYERSGFLIAQLELDEGDFCVEFEARVDGYGTGWDAGVHLLPEATPRTKVCAALRFLPAPYTNAAHNGLCLLSDDRVRYAFEVPVAEWVRARLEVSGGKCRGTVGANDTGWHDMGVRPSRLVIGATPVDSHAEGGEAHYLFRNLTVRPQHLG